ncbi:MAG: hypothetical protein HWE22_09410 [Flavobacteriales bacterium]|nr:hypothetical protein [Flavobacteriales bacterium]
MLKTTFGLIAITLLSFTSQAQITVSEWSELEKSPGRLLNLLPRDANDFFALRRTGRGIFGGIAVSSHKNLETQLKEKISLRANNSPANFEGSTIVGDHFVVFMSDKQEGRNNFFMQEYGEDLEPIGNAFELASYELESKRARFAGTFSLYQSENRNFFSVVWTIPGRKDEETKYGYKVFDADLQEVSGGTYEFPFESKYCRINTMHLSNTGDFFTVVTEYQESEDKKLFKNYANYKTMHIYHINSDGMEDVEINLEGKRVEALNINSDNNRQFILTGTYGERKKAGIKGLFYMKLDFKSQEILAEGFEEFSDDFITQDWSDRQKKKNAKKKARGKDAEPKLYEYVMRDIHILEDGSVVGSMEQFYIRVVTTRDPRTGATTTTYYYYYNDVIAFKVGADGGFDWHTKIDKYQVSTNDGGYFSSYERFVDDGKMYMIFNDNSMNYDESGNFSDPEKLRAATLSKRKNTVALVEVDLESGEFSRKMFFDRSELGAIAVPKLFNVDYNNGEVLVYAVKGTKEKFGIIEFGEQD